MGSEFNAVYYLWKRELIRYYRAKSRIIGSLAMPIFFLAFLGMGLGSAFTGVQGIGGSYMEFMAPGMIGMVLLFSSIFSGITVIMDKQFGILKEILVAPVSRFSVVMGKALGGTTTAIIQGILVLFIVMLMGIEINLYNLPLALIFMVLISLSFVSLGLAIASRMEDMHGFQLVMNFLIMPMFLLSSALFPLDGLPAWLKTISYLNPLTYGVDGLRGLFVGYSHFPVFFDLAVLAGFCVAMLLLGTYLFNKRE